MKTILFLSLPALMLPLLSRAADTVDLQWSVCDKSPEAVLSKIGEEEAESKEGKITYFDAATPRYIQDGITFRVKESKNKEESSVKIRFSQQREVPGADCEWDRYGQGEKFTCEVVGDGRNASDSIWSGEQKEFLSRYYRAVDESDLQAFGPYANRKWKLEHDGQAVSFDSVDADDAGAIMEFSLKVPHAGSERIAADFSDWLKKSGVVLCPQQESKTLRLFKALGLIK